jgi:preprotein translocase subunit Sec61beta
MADEKLSIPSAGGGLVRYFDEYKSKIQIKPEFIILIIVLVIIFEILLRLFIKF